MVGRQFVVVLDVCKTTHAYIKLKYLSRKYFEFANFLVLTTCKKWKPQGSDNNLLIHLHEQTWEGPTGMQEHLLTHSQLPQRHPTPPNAKEDAKWTQLWIDQSVSFDIINELQSKCFFFFFLFLCFIFSFFVGWVAGSAGVLPQVLAMVLTALEHIKVLVLLC